MNDLECSVCYNDIKEGKTLSCEHTFCAKCLDEWFKRKRNCPMCRKPVKGTLEGSKRIFLRSLHLCHTLPDRFPRVTKEVNMLIESLKKKYSPNSPLRNLCPTIKGTINNFYMKFEYKNESDKNVDIFLENIIWCVQYKKCIIIKTNTGGFFGRLPSLRFSNSQEFLNAFCLVVGANRIN